MIASSNKRSADFRNLPMGVLVSILMLISILIPSIGPAVEGSLPDLTPIHSHIFTSHSDIKLSHHPCGVNSTITCSASQEAGTGFSYAIAEPENVGVLSLLILNIDWLTQRFGNHNRPNEWLSEQSTPPPQVIV